MPASAAEAITLIARMPHVTEKVLKGFRTLALDWVEAAARLFAQGGTAEAYALVHAAQTVLPDSSVGRKLEREILNSIRVSLREAHSARDHAAVIARSEAAGGLIFARSELGVTYAQALLTTGRSLEALEVVGRLHEAFPGDIDVHALYAQVAASLDDFALALRLYGSLAQMNGDRAERYRSRSDRFLTTAARNGPARMRRLTAEGNFAAAVELGELLVIHAGISERLVPEFRRVQSALRRRLRELDADEEICGEVLHVLRLMLRIAPEDPSALRRAALEAMKLQDHATAIDYWNALERVLPGLESTQRNLHRSQTLLARQMRGQAGRSHIAKVA
jgi:tetratricopeptide (TPR) repeat protein